jgi:hypothetical protein
VLLPEIDEGLEGTSLTVTEIVFGVPLPHPFIGVHDNIPELFHETETAFPDPEIVAAVEGITLQL